VKRLLLLTLTLFASSAAFAIEVDPKVDRVVRDALTVCGDTKVTYEEMNMKLLPRFTGTLVRVESKHSSCEGQYAAILSPSGGFYLGMPWPISQEEGATAEEKLKNFVWRNMQMNVAPVIDRKKSTDDGLFLVTMNETTENGKMPYEGEIDADGKFFFMGHFRRMGDSIRPQRVKGFEPFFANLPVKGPEGAPVTIVEFSDFECPSCRRAAGYVDPILTKHAGKVRYVRFDLPLTMHPWAFGAALAGRAVHRQKPELFWEFKKQVYANQDSLTAFTFWDWARGFAEDHQLDLKRYDADLQNVEIRNEILQGAGSALSNEIRATPTYMINGAMVDPGDNGTSLAEYVDQLLAAK
jgi:hypothetical protein